MLFTIKIICLIIIGLIVVCAAVYLIELDDNEN